MNQAYRFHLPGNGGTLLSKLQISMGTWFHFSIKSRQMKQQPCKTRHCPWLGWQGATSVTSSQKSKRSLNSLMIKVDPYRMYTLVLMSWVNDCIYPPSTPSMGNKLDSDLNSEKWWKKYPKARYPNEERKQASTQYIPAKPQVSHEVNLMSFR